MTKKGLSSKSDKFRFAMFSTIIAFVLGLIAYTIPMAAEHTWFFISAPLATSIPSYLVWKFTFRRKKDVKISNIIAVAVLLTLITHYLNFVFLGLGRLICFYLTGYCTDYTDEVESLFGTLTYISFLRAGVSLYYWGILSFGLFVVTGIFVMKKSRVNAD